MRISAHILRGDVKFFPCASAVGVSPSARRGEKRGSVFGKGGFFSEKWRGKAKNRELFASALAEGCTDVAQALRRMAADELTGVYEGRALWALTDEGAR